MKSPLRWLGEKSRLAKRIVETFPPHTCYCEVFAGAAWVFFEKEPSRSEILNDSNDELVTLYRVIQHHPDEPVRTLQWMLPSRSEFERLKESPPHTLTDVQRAARFYYLNRTAFGGRMQGPTFGVNLDRPLVQDPETIKKTLDETHERLARVTIERLHYAETISRYDRPTTLFYLDPPYYGCETYYGHGLFSFTPRIFDSQGPRSQKDFGRLAELLESIKGKFVMSINDTAEIRALFSGFSIREVQTAYSVKSKENLHVTELLITNFEGG